MANGAFTQFPAGNNPGTSYGLDFILAKAFPGVVFNANGLAMEPLGIYGAVREVNGSMYYLNNADWNGSGFQQVNANDWSSAIYQQQNVLQFLIAPPNSPTPIVWTVVNLAGGPSSRAIIMYLSAGFTPTSVGVDLGSVRRVPFNPFSPTQSVTWTVTDIFFRLEVAASAGADGLKIARYTGDEAFAISNYINDTQIVISAGSFEQSTEPPPINNPQVLSGDKLACHWDALSTGAEDYGVYCVLTGSF